MLKLFYSLYSLISSFLNIFIKYWWIVDLSTVENRIIFFDCVLLCNYYKCK